MITKKINGKEYLFVESGAEFSKDRNYRYALWRIWDKTLPLVMFVGLNPSTANEIEPDNTIKRVCAIAKNNGYGGIYMMNCFAYVSTDPDKLIVLGEDKINDEWLVNVGRRDVAEIVFAWGNFKVVKDKKRDSELLRMFPNAKALHINKNGSPKHPLFCKSDTKLIPFKIKIQ